MMFQPNAFKPAENFSTAQSRSRAVAQRIKTVPDKSSLVQFPEAFGQRSLLTVDAEEEFDWDAPFSATDYGLEHVRKLPVFQSFCEELGVTPVYLVDWPFATSAQVIELLRPTIAAGKAEVGIQLHPWVNPPFTEQVTEFNSFAGNLPPDLEREKFMRLRDAIERNFHCTPRIYRAGRYGLGKHTAQLLTDAGVHIDTSIRAKYDYSGLGGPDYRAHPTKPWWIDRSAQLMELPLTTVFTGGLRGLGDRLYPFIDRMPVLTSLAARTSLLDRISLTPEGVAQHEAERCVNIAASDGLPVLVLSFHSPSVVPGYTPYVRSEADLGAFYDWWRAIYARLAAHGVKPTTVGEILSATGIKPR